MKYSVHYWFSIGLMNSFNLDRSLSERRSVQQGFNLLNLTLKTKSHGNCLMNWGSEPKYLCDSDSCIFFFLNYVNLL